MVAGKYHHPSLDAKLTSRILLHTPAASTISLLAQRMLRSVGISVAICPTAVRRCRHGFRVICRKCPLIRRALEKDQANYKRSKAFSSWQRGKQESRCCDCWTRPESAWKRQEGGVRETCLAAPGIDVCPRHQAQHIIGLRRRLRRTDLPVVNLWFKVEGVIKYEPSSAATAHRPSQL